MSGPPPPTPVAFNPFTGAPIYDLPPEVPPEPTVKAKAQGKRGQSNSKDDEETSERLASSSFSFGKLFKGSSSSSSNSPSSSSSSFSPNSSNSQAAAKAPPPKASSSSISSSTPGTTSSARLERRPISTTPAASTHSRSSSDVPSNSASNRKQKVPKDEVRPREGLSPEVKAAAAAAEKKIALAQLEGVSSFDHMFNSLVNKIYVTKQRVLEKIGHAEKTIDPATMKKIELLKNIQTTYSKLLVESNTMVESVSTFVGIHNEMGALFFDLGLADDVEPFLAEPLRETGELHKVFQKEGEKLLRALLAFRDSLIAFRELAVTDSVKSLEKFTQKRQEYDGGALHLENLKSAPLPDAGLIRDQQSVVDKIKFELDDIAFDLETKVVLLNDKRLKDLTLQLQVLSKAFETYYSQCSDRFKDFKLEIEMDHTKDFKALMDGSKDASS